MDTESLRGWHEKEPRGTHCGGYYKCHFCAEENGRAKALEAEAWRGPGVAPRRHRVGTQTDADAARARAARREKAKASRKARRRERSS